MNLKGKKRALEPLMFITWKESDTVRATNCANGDSRRQWIGREDASSSMQLFGIESYVTEIIGARHKKQLEKTLKDIVRKRGAPTRLISERDQVEITNEKGKPSSFAY
jgi:hypothetical protein